MVGLGNEGQLGPPTKPTPWVIAPSWFQPSVLVVVGGGLGRGEGCASLLYRPGHLQETELVVMTLWRHRSTPNPRALKSDSVSEFSLSFKLCERFGSRLKFSLEQSATPMSHSQFTCLPHALLVSESGKEQRMEKRGEEGKVVISHQLDF